MAKIFKPLVLNVVQSGQARQFIIHKGGSFTIGQQGDNDLTLYGQKFPKKHTLISQKNGSFLVNIKTFIDGEVSLNGSTLRINDLVQHDVLPRKGDNALLKLTHQKSGYFTIGDAKIEFMFPQTQSRQHVPIMNTSPFSWYRATLKGLTSDLLFKLIFLVILSLNILVLYSLKDYEVNIQQKFDIEKMPERLAKFIIKPPEINEDLNSNTLTSNNTDNSDSNSGSEKKENQKKSSDKSRNSNNKSGSRRGNPAASAGLLGLIGGTGSSSKSSSIVDALVDKGLVSDLKNIMGGGTHLKVSKGGTNKDEIDPLDQLIGTGGSGGIDDFLADMDEDVPQVTLKRKAKVDLVKPAKMTGSTEALGRRTEQSIMAVLRARQGRITYIYEKYLKTNPNLRGKISVEFTIAANGFVESAKVIESTIDHPQLEREILNMVKRLKFDAIPSGSVTTIFPFIFNKMN